MQAEACAVTLKLKSYLISSYEACTTAIAWSVGQGGAHVRFWPKADIVPDQHL